MQIVLHPSVWTQLEQIESHPFGSYLFLGPKGRGRMTAAKELMRRLNCYQSDSEPCASCRQFASDNHAQLTIIDSGDKTLIGIEKIRTLRADLALANYGSHGTRVIIIDGADQLTVDAQNAMLKLMEEPPAATVIILVAASRDKLLPTVRSRVQTVIFSEPDVASVVSWLGQKGIEPKVAKRALDIAPGLPGKALDMARNPADLEATEELTEVSRKLVLQSIFERLLVVRKLSDSKMPLRRLVAILEQDVHSWLRQGQDVVRQVSRLQAIELCYRRLDANVTPRLAVEALLLEL